MYPAIYDAVGGVRIAFLGKCNVPSDREAFGLCAAAQQAFGSIRSADQVLARSGNPTAGALPEVAVNHQVHSARVVEASRTPAAADGLISSGCQFALCVVTADCVPVLLADPERNTICALHAGWRGLAAAIVAAGVQPFPRPNRITAWIGPSIGSCCYQVSEHVADRIARLSGAGVVVTDSGSGNGVPGQSPSSRSQRPKVDLAGAAKEQLRRAGVEDIRMMRLCTRCEKSWHSYRREGAGQGRNYAFVWVE